MNVRRHWPERPHAALQRLRSLARQRPWRRTGQPWRATLPVPPPAVDRDAFREAMSAFPAPVSVVTALDAQGNPRGLTCSAVASLSLDPPTLLVCVNQANHSLEAIRGSGGFVVNLLRQGRDEVSTVFASPSPDKFSAVAWRPSPASGLPWLHSDALAFVDCRLVGELSVGSHAVLVGLARETRSAGANGAGPDDSGALLYWRRTYGRWIPLGAEALAAVPAARHAVAAGNGRHRS